MASDPLHPSTPNPGLRGTLRLAKRIIACLDVDAGRVVKGIQFQQLRDASPHDFVIVEQEH